MLSRGRWRALRPEVKNHAGFKLSALMSPLANASWGRLASEFLTARHDPALLKPFVNTVLAEPWRDAGDEVDEAALRVEAFSLAAIPEQVLCVCAGCDVQDDRIEISFCGFARDNTIFVLGHSVLYGPVTANEVWADLDDVAASAGRRN
jgi:phage terminase large subunit GpA-like protein